MPDIRLQALPTCQLYRIRLDLGGESIYDGLGGALSEGRACMAAAGSRGESLQEPNPERPAPAAVE